jgi:hypothetical protein
MTTYSISFSVEGPDLDTVVSSLINVKGVLDLAIGVAGIVPTRAEFTSGRASSRANGKHKNSSPLTNRDRVWQIVQTMDKRFLRKDLIRLATDAGIPKPGISSMFADWIKRGKVKKTGYGEYQRLS